MLPWRDVLHEGPVPGGLEPEKLGEVRARFLAEVGWATLAEARRDFAERDGTLMSAAQWDEIVLWFEADLYDQLQLVQILDRLAVAERSPRALSAVVVDGSLADCRAEDLQSLFGGREPVGAEHLEEATRAWSAFRSADPTELSAIASRPSPLLPFLGAALRRQLEQFPWTSDGLSRTERQILAAVAAGAESRGQVFLVVQRDEERPFMGDTALWSYLDRLASCREPLLAERGGTIALAESGRDVLAGRADAVRLNGIDRWLGGVHLVGETASGWRWDGETARLQPCPSD